MVQDDDSSTLGKRGHEIEENGKDQEEGQKRRVVKSAITVVSSTDTEQMEEPITSPPKVLNYYIAAISLL